MPKSCCPSANGCSREVASQRSVTAKDLAASW